VQLPEIVSNIPTISRVFYLDMKNSAVKLHFWTQKSKISKSVTKRFALDGKYIALCLAHAIARRKIESRKRSRGGNAFKISSLKSWQEVEQ
jgi:hypothetical protein